MISELRETITLDHGRVRQIFDVKNCPGLIVICDLAEVGADGEFESVTQRFEIPSLGTTFESADEALLAWDAAQTDHEIADALGHALLRYRHSLMRPLWEHRTDKDKVIWIAAARGFRRLLNSLGFDIARMEPK